MSFVAPLALLSLLAIPAALIAHQAAQRRRRRYPVRYPALATLAAVMPREPQWRRHLPVALFVAALAALAFALARPQNTIAVPVERASVVLVTDVSRSMSADDVSPTRLTAARNAAQNFLERVPDTLRVGLVSYSETAQTLQAPTTDHAQVAAALKTLSPISGTATGAGLNAALDALQVSGQGSKRRPPAAIVLLSDGKANDGAAADAAAAEARRLRVPIYTVALGTPEGEIEVEVPGGSTQVMSVPPDPEALERIAETSGGLAFRAEDSDELDAVYGRLGSQIGTRPGKEEITSLFAGGALLLLAGAVMTALRFGGRLP